MKKKFALIFLTLTCILLCSCGGTGGSSSSFFKTKKEIEITMDNWQEYFEIKDEVKSADTTINAFDEIETVYLHYGTYWTLKENFKKDFVSADIAIEVSNNQGVPALIKYNLDDKTFEIEYYEYSDNPYPYPFYEMTGRGSNRAITQRLTDIECVLDIGKNQQEFENVEGNVANIYVCFFPELEVTRIQGTLVLKE